MKAVKRVALMVALKADGMVANLAVPLVALKVVQTVALMAGVMVDL